MKLPYVVVLGAVACGGSDPSPDAGVQNPVRDQYNVWEKVELPGTVCGNNSQYKIWVNYSNTSDNLAVVFEPGGACWDYDSCTGKNGVRGAANPDGLPDDHYTLANIISPFLNRDADESPSRDWNYVYVPYCTGDVHTGNVVATYADESGASPDIMFHHSGHTDVMDVVAYLDSKFTHVPKMLVTGCSAGGVGALVNYQFLRKGVHAVQQAYLLDDSGPIFPSDGFSGPMHMKIRSAWNLDSLSPEMPPNFTLDDMGTINTALADEFPNDRLATTYFMRDMNFSLYSYERFYDPTPTTAQIHSMWKSDSDELTALYGTKQNLYYYLPYWRSINDSHCTTLFSFAGSEIQDHGMTLAQWVSDFLDDRPVSSMEEAPVPGEDP